MLKAHSLKSGDKVAIVSLSRGLLGEDDLSHNLKIGIKRLKEFNLEPVFMPNSLKGLEYLEKHPDKRAQDLKDAFADSSIKAIICAIGGDDTYRTLSFLLDDPKFIQNVKNNPKIFTGFSDSTHNHLMFYQLGLSTFYGPSFITDISEISEEMIPYTKEYFQCFFAEKALKEIQPSPIWYEERKDFSAASIGCERIAHEDKKGFELLQGADIFSGQLLGGCLDSLNDILTGELYPDQKEICQKYNLFPKDWTNKILFIETSEEKIKPEKFADSLRSLKNQGIFNRINGLLVGKPQDEIYYEEYKNKLIEIIDNPSLPILYNLNFGHAIPRCILPYGIEVEVNANTQKIVFLEDILK